MFLNKCSPSLRLCLHFLKPVCSIYLCLPVHPLVPAFLQPSPKLKANELTCTCSALPKEFLCRVESYSPLLKWFIRTQLTGITCVFDLRVPKIVLSHLCMSSHFAMLFFVIGQKLVHTWLHISLSPCLPHIMLAWLVHHSGYVNYHLKAQTCCLPISPIFLNAVNVEVRFIFCLQLAKSLSVM